MVKSGHFAVCAFHSSYEKEYHGHSYNILDYFFIDFSLINFLITDMLQRLMRTANMDHIRLENGLRLRRREGNSQLHKDARLRAAQETLASGRSVFVSIIRHVDNFFILGYLSLLHTIPDIR